jgi:molybdopterin molybdotransferase
MPKLLGKLVSVDEAVERLTNILREKTISKLRILSSNIWNSNGLILAEDFTAKIDQPIYDRAAVDGYAVISSDTTGASPLNPVILRVKGYMSPGMRPSDISISSGEAVEITTGAPLPLGADAVVMFEDTNRKDDFAEIYKPVASGANVSKRGEDYRRGELLISKNTLLKPWHLAIIASNGVKDVNIYERIRIGIIVSGNELLEPGSRYVEGKIYNSTGVLVKNYLDNISFVETRYYGIFPDKREALENILFKILGENHLVITTGGTGVSDEDVIRDIVSDYGRWVFRGVAMRPGRPTSVAVIGDKPVIMLSGYPVAAWTGLEAIVNPALYLAWRIDPPRRPTIRGIITRRIPNTIGYRSYIRVHISRGKDQRYYIEPYMLKGSGVLSSLVKTNGYIILYEDLEGYEEGDEAEAFLYAP